MSEDDPLGIPLTTRQKQGIVNNGTAIDMGVTLYDHVHNDCSNAEGRKIKIKISQHWKSWLGD